MLKEEKDFLKSYDSDKYQKPSVTVDVAICTIINKELNVLLIKRGGHPYKGKMALPGGFVDLPAKETLDETAARELLEETGLKGIFIEQLKTYGDPDRDPRMRVITVAYYALLPFSKLGQVQAGDDAVEAGWFSFRELPELAFDHKVILKDVYNRIIGKLSYTPIAFNLVHKEFTWTELQEVYEAILGKTLIVPDFRTMITSKYDIEVLDKKKKLEGKGRPSSLLKLAKEKK